MSNEVTNTDSTVGKTQRAWTEEEMTKALNYMSESIRWHGAIEKPSAAAYYKKLLLECKFPPNATVRKLQNKLHHYKKKFLAALKWSNETGQGVRQEEGAISFKQKLHRMCPLFELCDEVWGSKVTTRIPFIAETTQVGPTDNDSKDPTVEFNSFLEELDESQRCRSRSPVEQTTDANKDSPEAKDSQDPPRQGTSQNLHTGGKTLERIGRSKPVAKHSLDLFCESLASSQMIRQKLMQQTLDLKLAKHETFIKQMTVQSTEALETAKINLEIEKEKTIQKQIELEELKLRMEKESGLGRIQNN